MFKLDEIELKEISYPNEYMEQRWIKYLEISKLKKKLVTHYNTKQALITALRRLGINDDLAKNEILLSTIISDNFGFSIFNNFKYFPFPLDSTLNQFYNMPTERAISILDDIFKETVENYVNFLKNSLIIEDKEDNILISFFTTTYSCETGAKNVKSVELFFKELLKNNIYESGCIERIDVLLNRNNNYTKVIFNKTCTWSWFDKKTCKVFSTTCENIYDSVYRMISSFEYEYLDDYFDISNFPLANSSLYKNMNGLFITGDLDICKYVQKSKEVENFNFEIDIEIEYDKIGFDFSNLECFQEKNPDSELLICLFNRHNHLFKQQVDFYNFHGISEYDYVIQWDDPGFYSIIYNFSKNMKDKATELYESRLIEYKK